jgi:hypothetical protein
LKELEQQYNYSVEQENQSLLAGRKDSRAMRQGDRLVSQNYRLEGAKKEALEIEDYA